MFLSTMSRQRFWFPKRANNPARGLMGLFVIFLILGSWLSPVHAQETKKLTIETIFASTELSGKGTPGLTWSPDGRYFAYYRTDENNDKKLILYQCEARTGSCKEWLTNEEVPAFKPPRREKRFTLPNFIISPDGKAILFPTEKDLFLYDLETRQLKQLTDDSAEERDPTFSPDGQWIAFLKNHNLHVLHLPTGTVKQLTNEGTGDILIGQFDWVYEEEFGIRTGFFWSPDSQYLAFFKVDQRAEPLFPIVDFIPTHNTVENMRYPKAGDTNATVTIGVVPVRKDEEQPAITWLEPGPVRDGYIPRIKWLPNSRQVALMYLNRAQNDLTLYVADIKTGKSRQILRESIVGGWIDIVDHWYFFKKQPLFLWTSEKLGFRHIFLYDLSGKRIRQVTRGLWEVTDIAGVDEDHGWIYFIATRESPLERHLYRVDLYGRNFTKLSDQPGWHSVLMSPDHRYYIDRFSNVETPTQVRLYDASGRLVQIVEANPIEKRSEYAFTVPEFIKIKAADGSDMYAFVHKPADFDESRKYPVLFYTYGGPGSQIVVNRWTGARWYYWHQLLANEGMIIVGVDNRGTGGRGRAWKHKVYYRLGTLEPEDQVAAARYFQSLPYVDAGRIGIWGWSYGGYNTLMTLLKGGTVFKAGIAVAPVTDWRNYDTIYTERYMGTPEDNPSGYDEGSAIKLAKNLRSQLLIIHGSSDDNVHLANTMQLAYELQNHRIPFEMMVYPRKLHGIRGKDTRVHLFHLMLDFIRRTLLSPSSS